MGKWINRLKSEAGANIGPFAALVVVGPFAAGEEVDPHFFGGSLQLRRRKIVDLPQVRSADAAETIAQGGVAACGANHGVPLIPAGQQPCGTADGGLALTGALGRAPVHRVPALVGQRKCQAMGVGGVVRLAAYVDDHGHGGGAGGSGIGLRVVDLAVGTGYLALVVSRGLGQWAPSLS